VVLKSICAPLFAAAKLLPMVRTETGQPDSDTMEGGYHVTDAASTMGNGGHSCFPIDWTSSRQHSECPVAYHASYLKFCYCELPARDGKTNRRRGTV